MFHLEIERLLGSYFSWFQHFYLKSHSPVSWMWPSEAWESQKKMSIKINPPLPAVLTSLIGPPWRVLWNRVCPSRHLLEIAWLDFSKFQNCVRNPYGVVHDRAWFLFWKFVAPKMSHRWRFLNLLKNLVINFSWICFIMKVYVISYVLAEIPYLGEIWFLTS